jgi:hypothetical protein
VRRTFIGAVLIIVFIFGGIGGGHWNQINPREAAEEDTASEEREEKSLRSRSETSRSQLRKRKKKTLDGFGIGVPLSLNTRALFHAHTVLAPAAAPPDHRRRFLPIFRI